MPPRTPSQDPHRVRSMDAWQQRWSRITSNIFAPEPSTAADAAGGKGRAAINRSCGIMDRNQLVRALPDRRGVARDESHAWMRDMCKLQHPGSNRGGQSSRTASTAPAVKPAPAAPLGLDMSSSVSSQLSKKLKRENGLRSGTGSATPTGSDDSDVSPLKSKGRGPASSVAGAGSLAS